jgi:hypothetical protein
MSCQRGDSCIFAHSTEEILYHPLKYKTELCKSIFKEEGIHQNLTQEHVIDSFKNMCISSPTLCPYAHSKAELR